MVQMKGVVPLTRYSVEDAFFAHLSYTPLYLGRPGAASMGEIGWSVCGVPVLDPEGTLHFAEPVNIAENGIWRDSEYSFVRMGTPIRRGNWLAPAPPPVIRRRYNLRFTLPGRR